jgi:hypothetical protein
MEDEAEPDAPPSWPLRVLLVVGVAIFNWGWLTAIVLGGLGAFAWYVPGWTEVGVILATAAVIVGLLYFLANDWLPWP